VGHQKSSPGDDQRDRCKYTYHRDALRECAGNAIECTEVSHSMGSDESAKTFDAGVTKTMMSCASQRMTGTRQHARCAMHVNKVREYRGDTYPSAAYEALSSLHVPTNCRSDASTSSRNDIAKSPVEASEMCN
jgi:hypothetical protein